MATQYLDKTGLSYFWEKIKSYVASFVESKGYSVYESGTSTQLTTGSDTTDKVWSPKVLHDYVDASQEDMELSEVVKQALLQIASKVVYKDSDNDYYGDLCEAFYGPIVSISVTFTQGQENFYGMDSLDVLRQYLVVIATYSDDYSRVINNYTLSGILSVGTSTITVSYGGKTDTFDVTVAAEFQVAEITDSWDTILAGDNDYRIGNYKPLDLGTEGIIRMQIVGKGVDKKSDNSGYAQYTWLAMDPLATVRRMNPAKVANTSGTGTLGGWEATEMRAYLKSTIKPLIPSNVRDAIVSVDKSTQIFRASDETVIRDSITSEDVWLASHRELFNADNRETIGPTYGPICSTENNMRYINNSATRWWMRTASSATQFRLVNLTSASGAGNVDATNSATVIGFCTGTTSGDSSIAYISATYTQTGLEKSTDSLESFKANLVVTATYADSSTSIIPSTNYTLTSGTLVSGSNRMQVQYLGKIAELDVVVDYLMFYDFTESLTDKITDFTAVLDSGSGYSDPQRDSTGLKFTAPTQSAYFGLVPSESIGKTIEYDVASMDFKGDLSYDVRLLMLTNGQNSTDGTSPFIFRSGVGYSAYGYANGTEGDTEKRWSETAWEGMSGSTKAVVDIISGKKIKIQMQDSGSYATVSVGTSIYGSKSSIWFDKGEGAPNYNHLKFGSLENDAAAGDQCYDLVLTGLRVY